MNQKESRNANCKQITRKQALKKIGAHSKYAALTALGTYLILNPQKSQAQSVDIPPR